MARREKLIILARHGEAKEDILVPKSVERIYKNISIPLREKYFLQGLDQEDCFLWHSGQKRTEYTGKAILAGALDLKPRKGRNPPRSQEDLENYSFESIEIEEYPFLNYDYVKYDEEQFDEDEEEYMRIWIGHPNYVRGKYGEDITSFNTMIIRSRACLGEAVLKLIEERKNLGVLVTHMSIAEPLAITALNYAKPTPEKRATLEDIGGVFGEEQYAELTFERGPKDVYNTGEFILGEKKHNINLVKLLGMIKV